PERESAGRLNPSCRVAAREAQHRQRGVDALLSDGYGLENSGDHDRRVRADTCRPFLDPCLVPFAIPRPFWEVTVTGAILTSDTNRGKEMRCNAVAALIHLDRSGSDSEVDGFTDVLVR